MTHTHEHSHGGKQAITLAFWLNLLFSILEVIGGIVTNSTAIIADAFHDFMDAVAIGAAVLLEKKAETKRTPLFSYGYKRFSLLAALGLSLFLLVGTALMSISAIRSFVHPKEVNSLGMLWLAVLGIVINGFAFLKIKKSNGHEEGHSHNSRAIMTHLLEDVLGWIAVLIGAVVIYFTGWYWIDGALTLGIALFIGYNAGKNLISTMKVLLQSVPENVDLENLSKELNSIEGVENIHDLHLWSLDGTYNIGSLHAVVNLENKSKEESIYISIVQILKKYRIQHPTIQLETSSKNCSLVDC